MMSYLLLLLGLIPFLCTGNPVPDRVFCFQTHTPRGAFGPCETEQLNPNNDGTNQFETAAECCAQAGAAGWTPNRSGSRCSACSALEENDGVEGNPNNGDGDVDGGWTDWDGWTDCSVTCGEGVKTKTRTCTNPSPRNNGRDCNGASTKEKSCNLRSCAVNGNWGEWSVYGECSATCGSDAVRSRSRVCDNPAPMNGGLSCQGDAEETSPCEDRRLCPINGVWSVWGQWSGCSVTCGDGTQERRRQCNNPAPQHGGEDCQGDSQAIRTCTLTTVCPIHGGWNEWLSWGKCSSTQCNVTGIRIRQRYCNNPRPEHGGRYCAGMGNGVQGCVNTDACPVDGGFGEWGEWGECSSTCGSFVTQSRERPCNNPRPRNGGEPCMGRPKEDRDCVDDLPPCPTEAPYSGDCDDEDAECETSGSGSGAGPTAEPTAEPTAGPCDDIADDYLRIDCQWEVDNGPVDVPGNEDITTPVAPTEARPIFNPEEYSFSVSY